jgi:drug/metabolite transporter (DMT)-like permease
VRGDAAAAGAAPARDAAAAGAAPARDAAAAGAALCLLSAAAFGAMGVFGKLAYDEGVGVWALLLVRFGLAAAGLLVVVAFRRALAGLSRRAILAGLAMGAVGYATQSTLYFLALERMDASLLALLLYTFPAMVVLGAVLLGRERITARRLVALGFATTGTALVLAGAGTGALDPLGTVMGLGAAVAYTAYILAGERVVAGVPPLTLAALVATGATATFAIVNLAQGPELGFSAAGWGWLALIALVSTVLAIIAFFAGLTRVGPSSAAILSTLEPPVTVALAAAAFGEALTPLQLFGGALVLATVFVLNAPVRRRIATTTTG